MYQFTNIKDERNFVVEKTSENLLIFELSAKVSVEKLKLILKNFFCINSTKKKTLIFFSDVKLYIFIPL